MAASSADLFILANAADPNVCGAAVLSVGQQIPAGWHVVNRADGTNVRLDTTNGQSPLAAATTAVLNADVSDTAVAARNLSQSRATANGLLMAGATPDNIGTRAADAYAFTHANDIAEALVAYIQLVCQRANIAVPTVTDVANQITANRTGQTIPPGTPAPTTVAANATQRIQQAAIVSSIQAVLSAGGGDPIT